jgi:crossover junction endodeoxyribonuclease RuvC
MIVGIDIGLQGAIAELDETGELVAIHDMPGLADGPKGRSAINAPLLAGILTTTHAVRAYIEYVGPRPLEGAASGFTFGRCRSVIEGVLAALGVPVTFLTPPVWKRIIGIPPGKVGTKDMARSEAIRRWPRYAASFALVKDADRAESALIAVAGILRERAP